MILTQWCALRSWRPAPSSSTHSLPGRQSGLDLDHRPAAIPSGIRLGSLRGSSGLGGGTGCIPHLWGNASLHALEVCQGACCVGSIAACRYYGIGHLLLVLGCEVKGCEYPIDAKDLKRVCGSRAKGRHRTL